MTLRVSKDDPGAFRRDQPVEDLGPDRIVLGLFEFVNNVRVHLVQSAIGGGLSIFLAKPTPNYSLSCLASLLFGVDC